jgi:hypothetical protein
MKNWFLPLFFLIAFSPVSAAEETSQPIELTFTPGLEFSFHSIAIRCGEQETANRFNVLAPRLTLQVDFSGFFTLEVLAGYHFAHARDPLYFAALPLSLGWDRQKFQGLLLGAALAAEPLTFGDFSLKGRGEFIFVMEKDKVWEVTLPLVSGQATGENAFTLITLDVTLQYQGLSGLTLFLGPRLNLLHGKFIAAETVADLEGQQEMIYRQKNLIGPLAGAVLEIGDNWELTFMASLLARTELSLAVAYIF